MVWKMPRNFVLGTVVLVATIRLSGLSPSLALAAPPADACALLTQAQAGVALGGTVDAGKPLTSQTCHWNQQGKAGLFLVYPLETGDGKRDVQGDPPRRRVGC